MKPTNIMQAPSEFWVLRDNRGEFYAYSDQDGVRCTDRIEIARKYFTRKGATVAMTNVLKAYGKQTEPKLYRLTYHP